MAAAQATTDHETIRSWVEARGGHPARVKGTGRTEGDPGILRIDYPGLGGEGKLEEMSWNEFFEAFEANDLAFLYQDEENSRFSKLVHRDTVELEEEEDFDEEDFDEEDFDEEEDTDEAEQRLS